jgi:hypothetical protein
MAKWRAVAQFSLDASARFLEAAQRSGSVAHGTSEMISLRGAREVAAKFPALGRRYVPKNVGYATIVSTLADVFALRLRGSKRLVSYRITPVADVPPDINTVTFMINPAYSLAGSLDGMVGEHPADARIYGHVPQARAQFGSRLEASYFRPREAYALRDAIERRNRDLEAFSISLRADLMDSELAKASRVSGQAPGDDKDAHKGAAEGAASDVVTEIDRQKGAQKRPDTPATIDELIAQTPKGNIVNSYVWDGDGGLRSQTQVFATSWRLVLGGSFSVDLGGGAKAQFMGFGAGFLADVMLTAHMSMSFTHTTEKSRAIELNVGLDCESRDITDNLDRPLHPGQKVDRYRFMSFALQANTAHFNDFFDKVVDPEWLRSDDEEAMLLRQIDRTKPNQAWRVLHRVTYVERPSRGAASKGE